VHSGYIRVTSVICQCLLIGLTLGVRYCGLEEILIAAQSTSQENRSASARAFVHSLNILIKYARMYGYQHKRTEAQFEITWNELQNGLPTAGDAGFLLGVSDNKLLLDGIPLETGNAERSFANLLNAAGLASLHFSKDVTVEDFTRLVRAFTIGGSKAQDVSKQIKEALGMGKEGNSTIRINEVKFVAADPLTGDVSIAAQIAAQTLGPEFKQWLNDPQKLLQLIAAAEGANSKGGGGPVNGPSAPLGSVPNVPIGGGSGVGGTGTGAAPAWTGGIVPLQEAEVIQAIRLLTRFGHAQDNPNIQPEDLQKDLAEVDPNTRLNLQQLLGSLSAKAATSEEQDTPLLMKAAEHMAIRFALERYQKGEVKVNAVHQMMEHMSRQMDSLRKILRTQEDKMNKAGILIESHADILDRMFWAEVPESGKKSVLMSHEAACVPPRNVRQFVEVLLERDDKQVAEDILKNYSTCLSAREAEPRRKTAIGLSQLADLYARLGGDAMGDAIHKLSDQLVTEKDPELQSLISAAFVRLSQEASSSKNYAAVNEVCAGMEAVFTQRPVLGNDLRPRVGVEKLLAAVQPPRGLFGQRCTIEVEFADLLEPALKLFEVGILLLKLGVSELLDRDLLGDLGFECLALAEKLAVLVVTIRLEACDHLVLLDLVQGDGLQKHGFAVHLGNVVLEHLQPTSMVVGLGQEADAVLEIDGTHTLEPPPNSNPLGGRLSRYFVGEQEP